MTDTTMNIDCEIKGYGGLVGDSPAMRDVYAMIEKTSKIDVPVLIFGETGTGKELVAREIHNNGPRNSEPFVAVNTGALSVQLVASELFGHVKGSFTGAVDNKAGRFAEAHGGTLFLDEIATMDERVQIALLRVLETSTFRPVGAKRDKKVNVRLLAATNVDLRLSVNGGRFRQDVLHRLEVFSITLPALRQHIEDVPLLSWHFLESINADFGLHISDIDSTVMECLMAYHWPGNIRELKNVIAQSAVMAEEGPLLLEHLPTRIAGFQAESTPPTEASFSDRSEYSSLSHESQDAVGAEPDSPDVDGIFTNMGEPLEDVVKAYILKTLAHCSYNKTHAAEKLGVSRKTLYDKLLQWGMEKRRV